MTRRVILSLLGISLLGFFLPQEQVRVVFWPRSEHDQDVILNALWLEGYRLRKVLEGHEAEFLQV